MSFLCGGNKINSVICRYRDSELEVNNIERNEVSGKEPAYRSEFILGLIIGGFILIITQARLRPAAL
jgi:hypothetical protein